ncbi:5-formyltetrahydrofolate cyclo-ligase [Allocoleopsis franciscana]|uniref:5-formyltetrahydrofolate cyclo-ligase n=1 Tax=Allocoleopsis franciscana PCC 7113 TaxID=1173027 RepID=K9WJ73_9CYAN|nr:5-formyltetrahydrofolate cyclo-ligase [Allocoleopsis franciscana]AFZ19557.1 5,10-methenyltetrahydrofolate synthetase [Allocoleopsis franciscana PCC 7113]
MGKHGESQPNKSKWRQILLQKRQSLSVEAWQEKSDRLCSHLQSSPLFSSARTILAYFSFRQEPDLSPLFTDSKRCWGFPRIEQKSLVWHRWMPGDYLSKGDYGIFEPYPDSPILTPHEVDLILVPSVACDARGYRLGYGGGFYDRLLSSADWASKPTIGIVFEFAYVSHLPVDPWDKPLHSICTEDRFQVSDTP